MTDPHYHNKNTFFSLTAFEIVTFIITAVWLTFAAWTVQVEFYDGLDTIMNTVKLLGDRDEFITNRAPLISVLLIPAYFLNNALDLGPLDFRPYHVTMAVLHLAYLLVTYLLLIKIFGRSAAVLLAFIAAILNYLFFSYTPFISHDIFPGVLLLAMLYLTSRFIQKPSQLDWILLVSLGAAAALIKHIYGLFWISILFAQLILTFFNQANDRSMYSKPLLLLSAAAICSGLITWLVLASALSTNPDYIDSHFLFRPAKQLGFLITGASGDREFPLWVYIRNLPAYGLVAMICLPLGLYSSIKGNNLQKLSALSFIFIVIFMHIISSREVRYLAHLSPVIALLIVPVITHLLTKKKGRLFITVTLLVSIIPAFPYSPVSEATRLFHPFYSGDAHNRIFNNLPDQPPRPLLINWGALEFLSPVSSALKHDAYHRHFHMTHHHFLYITGYDYPDLQLFEGNRFDDIVDWPDTTMIIATHVLVDANNRFTDGKSTPAKTYFANKAFKATSMLFHINEDSNYSNPDHKAVMAIDNIDDQTYLTIHSQHGDPVDLFMPHIHFGDAESSHPLIPAGPNRYIIQNHQNIPGSENPTSLLIHAFAAL